MGFDERIDAALKQNLDKKYGDENKWSDAKVNPFLDKYVDRSMRGEEEFKKEALEGTEAPRGLLDTQAQVANRQQAALGGPVNPAISEAIQKRSMKMFDNEAAKMKMNADLKAKVDKQKAVSTGLAARISAAQADLGLQENALNNRLAEEQARSSVLGSILGAVGTVGGFLLGGPLGAAAGSAVSKGVGKSGYGPTLG